MKSNGVLEVISEGYGFLRSSDYNYLSSPDDVYVASSFVKKFGLKTGDVIECKVRPPHEGEKYFPLTSIIKINGRDPSEFVTVFLSSTSPHSSLMRSSISVATAAPPISAPAS